MTGDQAGRNRGVPNTLRDQALPNVLRGAKAHVAPARNASQGEAGRPPGHGPPGQTAASTPADEAELEAAAARLYALAVSATTHAEAVEAELLEDFQAEAAPLARQCGDLLVREGDDERIWFRADGSFTGDVVPEDDPTAWRRLRTPFDIVDFYDPSDLFADLADRLAAAHPSVGSPAAENAGPRLRQLAESFAERSAARRERTAAGEVGLIEQFEMAAAPFTRTLGDIIFRDDPDQRLTLERDGRFVAQVIPEIDESSWRTLRNSQQVIEYYTPEELFRALAEELQRAFPAAADSGVEMAAGALRDLALVWRDQSLDAEATLFAEFNQASAKLAPILGEFAVVDEDDEQLVVDAGGHLWARVQDRPVGTWRVLDSPRALVESYDPTDVFADLADALVDAFPALAPREPG